MKMLQGRNKSVWATAMQLVVLRKKGLLHSCPLALKQGEHTEPMLLLQTGLLGPLTTQCDLLC